MEKYTEPALYLLDNTEYRPTIGIICGSGLSRISDRLTGKRTFSYEEIPQFPQISVQGHVGELVFGKMNEYEVVCMRGRFHMYEGYSPETVAAPVRILRLLGVQLLIVTNAAGGIARNLEVGNIVCIQDHFNLPGLSGLNPLRGHNIPEFGVRFPPISDMYDPKLQDIFMNVAKDLNYGDIIVPNGVYGHVIGPSYESRTESKFLNDVGCSVVGMSTLEETVTARHCGMAILTLSIVTNKARFPGDEGVPASHEEVLESVEKSTETIEDIVDNVIREKYIGEYMNQMEPIDFDITKYRKKNTISLLNVYMVTAFFGLSFLVTNYFRK